MAALITPREAGMELEPVNTVVDWSRLNWERDKLGLQPQEYEEFKAQIQSERQGE